MELSPKVIALVPVIIAVIEVAKTTGLKTRYAAPLALVLGVAGVFAVAPLEAPGLSVVAGLIVGSMASGFYSGFRATTGV